MDDGMGHLIRKIRRQALRRVGKLAAELVEAPSGEREVILAELEFEQWRADSCAVCQDND